MLLRHVFTLLFLVTAPLCLHAQREKLPPEDLEFVEKTWPDAKKTNTGIRYVILAEGKGERPKPGDLVTVSYTGWLLNGTEFDKSLKPFSFRVGRGNVIQGWDEVLQLMHVGERRVVIIPFELAYGTRGHPPAIPPRATLVFEIELAETKR